MINLLLERIEREKIEKEAIQKTNEDLLKSKDQRIQELENQVQGLGTASLQKQDNAAAAQQAAQQRNNVEDAVKENRIKELEKELEIAQNELNTEKEANQNITNTVSTQVDPTKLYSEDLIKIR